MKPYYYVYRVGSSRGPTVKHPTLESATAGSLRLSGQHPGETFEILQCLGITRTTEPSTFWCDGSEPPPTERPKFAVGQVWRDRDGNLQTIADVHPDGVYPVRNKGSHRSWTLEGRLDLETEEDGWDLVELISEP